MGERSFENVKQTQWPCLVTAGSNDREIVSKDE